MSLLKKPVASIFVRETVYQEFSYTWSEEDWNKQLEWLKGRVEETNKKTEELNEWDKENIDIYEHLKDLSWEKVAKILEEEADDITWKSNAYKYEHEMSVKELVTEWMRDDAYETGEPTYLDSDYEGEHLEVTYQ